MTSLSIASLSPKNNPANSTPATPSPTPQMRTAPTARPTDATNASTSTAWATPGVSQKSLISQAWLASGMKTHSV